jgi:hypothetical protein
MPKIANLTEAKNILSEDKGKYISPIPFTVYFTSRSNMKQWGKGLFGTTDILGGGLSPDQSPTFSFRKMNIQRA